MPPTLTALTSHPARPGRVHVEIDDHYAFELSRKAILALSVIQGEVLTLERLALLETAAAREAAIGLLARRERSRAELSSALKRKRFSPDVVTAVLDGLERERLQSDSRFAGAWVETRRRLSPRGRAALAYELKQKGIGDSEIDPALKKYTSSEERAALKDLIEARLARMDTKREDKAKVKARLLAFLARRGFAYEDIRAVLAEHFPEWV